MKSNAIIRKQFVSKLTAGLIGVLALGAISCGSTSSGVSSVKPYPYQTCIVTGTKLGSMGDPVTKVYNGQEVKFCCQPCIKKFEANPDKYLSMLR